MSVCLSTGWYVALDATGVALPPVGVAVVAPVASSAAPGLTLPAALVSGNATARPGCGPDGRAIDNEGV